MRAQARAAAYKSDARLTKRSEAPSTLHSALCTEAPCTLHPAFGTLHCRYLRYMVRLFIRGDERLRVETRKDRASGELVLILDQADGTRLVDRFRSKSRFQKRLEALERRLRARRWTARQSAQEL